MASQKINIVDIAKKAGVSISTVSRVLNGKAEQFRISEKSQQKIRETAKKLNYVPNQFAANLKSGKSNTIALIIPSLSNPFFCRYRKPDKRGSAKPRLHHHHWPTAMRTMRSKTTSSCKCNRANIEGLVIAPYGPELEEHQKAP